MFSTEVTSSNIASDNPLYQRTALAYKIVKSQVKGDTLEIGCGEGYGIPFYIENTDSLTLVDKSKNNLNTIRQKFPESAVYCEKIPPLQFLKNNSFDTIISFQVIEHIKNDDFFLKEIKRLLKPNGTAFISTPNKAKTTLKNPWHYREYVYDELSTILKKHFKTFEILGISGNAKTSLYYNKSKASSKKILAFDVFQLNKCAPRFLLKIPYEIGNRLNRILLFKKNKNLITQITSDDYSLSDFSDDTLDFYCILKK